MNYLLLCTLIITLFSSIHTMDHLPQTSSIWAITCDNQLIEIDEVIAQQSNLLMFLQKKYIGTQNRPIPVAVSKSDFDFFCTHLTTPASQLLVNLSNADYSKIMNIAEKLKCSIFYAELMEALVVEKNLMNVFVANELNNKVIIKPVSDYFIEKKCIKKSKFAFSDTEIKNTRDGKYFTENISIHSDQEQMQLWSTHGPNLIKTFPIGYSVAVFSPDSKYIVVGPARKPSQAMQVSPILYSIEQDTQYDLLSNFELYSKYNVIFDPKNHRILQLLTKNYNHKRMLVITELSPNNGPITIETDTTTIESFAPIANDNEYFFGKNDKKQLLLCKISSPQTQHIFLEKYKCQAYPRVLKTNPLLICYANDKHIKIYSFSFNHDISPVKLKRPNCNIHVAYNAELNIMAYTSEQTTLQIINYVGNEIALHNLDPKKWHAIKSIHFNKTGNYLVSLCDRIDTRRNFLFSSLIFWDFNNPSSSISGIRIDRPHHITEIVFTREGNLLTQGHKTELWNMYGDKLATIGKKSTISKQISDHSFLLIKKNVYDCPLANGSLIKDTLSTKLYHIHIDENQIANHIQEIKKRLSLSQTLLLNAYYFHRKDKKPTILYPNMPDGRALASLKHHHIFKNFKLAKQNFTQKIPLTSQL